MSPTSMLQIILQHSKFYGALTLALIAPCRALEACLTGFYSQRAHPFGTTRDLP